MGEVKLSVGLTGCHSATTEITVAWKNDYVMCACEMSGPYHVGWDGVEVGHARVQPLMKCNILKVHEDCTSLEVGHAHDTATEEGVAPSAIHSRCLRSIVTCIHCHLCEMSGPYHVVWDGMG